MKRSGTYGKTAAPSNLHIERIVRRVLNRRPVEWPYHEDIHLTHKIFERLVRLESESGHIRLALSSTVTTLEKRIDQSREETHARFAELREDINARFSAVEARLDALDTRFSAVEARLTPLDARLSTQREETNTRFVELRRDMDAGFAESEARDAALEAKMNIGFAESKARDAALETQMNTRFAAMDRRFSDLQWFIGIGFGLLTALMTMFKFV